MTPRKVYLICMADKTRLIALSPKVSHFSREPWMWEHFQIRIPIVCKWAANNCNSAGSSVETRLPIITHGGNCALTNRSGNQKPKYRSHM